MAVDTNLPTVVPGARLVAALRRADARGHLHRGAGPWRATEHLTFSAWVEQATQLPRLAGEWPGGDDFLLTPGQAAAIWEDVVKAPLSGVSAGLAAAQIEPVSVLAADAHRLLVEWGLEDAWRRGGAPVLAGVFAGENESPEHRAMRAWLPDFRRRCRQHGACDPVDLLALAANHLRAPAARFAGFGMAGPTLQRFGVSACDLAQPPNSARLVRFLQREDETSAACDWALAHRAAGVEGGVAVVLPDTRAMEAFGRQVERYRQASATPRDEHAAQAAWAGAVGLELAALPMLAHALLVLALPAGLRAADAMTLLQSPYLAGYRQEAAARARLVAQMMGYRHERYAGNSLANLVRTSSPRLATAFDAVLGLAAQAPRRQSLQAWMAHAQGTLRAAGWPGEQALGTVERAASDDLARAFDETAELDAVLGSSTARDAQQRLRRVLRRRRLSLPVAADAIELLTLEEAVAVQPAAVWVLGLNDSLYPRLRTPSPLLPQSLLREGGVPGSVPARDLEFDRACLAQLCSHAREVKLSCAELEGESRLRPSPGLVLDEFPVPPARRLAQRWRDAPAATVEARPGDAPVPLSALPEVAVRGGVRVLADQAACPFRAFASHRLRLRPLELKPQGPDARERGTLVHAVLAAFWRKVRTQEALLALDDAKLSHQVEAAVTAGLAAEEPPLPAPLAALEHQRLTALLGEWLAVEKLRKPFEVLEIESSRQFAIGGLRFSLQIDRVDEIRGADGRALFIIDYKTGDPKARGWDVPRPDEPQLLLYALARTGDAGTDVDAPAAVAGIGFARVVRDKAKWVTLPGKVLEASEPPALTVEITAWRDELETLAAGFRAGDAAVDPKRGDQTCRYCEYTVLCRRHEAPGAAAEEEPDDHE